MIKYGAILGGYPNQSRVFLGQIAIDSMGRYVAESRIGSAVIRNVHAMKVILDHHTVDEIIGVLPYYGGYTRFFDNGKRIVFMPEHKRGQFSSCSGWILEARSIEVSNGKNGK